MINCCRNHCDLNWERLQSSRESKRAITDKIPRTLLDKLNRSMTTITSKYNRTSDSVTLAENVKQNSDSIERKVLHKATGLESDIARLRNNINKGGRYKDDHYQEMLSMNNQLFKIPFTIATMVSDPLEAITFNRKAFISELQKKNDLLPNNTTKKDYQKYIDNANLIILVHEVNACYQLTGQLPVKDPETRQIQVSLYNNIDSGSQSDLEKTMTALKEEIATIPPRAEKYKTVLTNIISDSLTQLKRMGEIETKLNYYESSDSFSIKEEIEELRDKNESLILCERKNNVQKRIDMLESKSQELKKLTDDYYEVKNKINSVFNYPDSREPKTADKFEEVEQLVSQLPAGAKKLHFLSGIQQAKEILSAVMEAENIFTHPGELLKGMKSSKDRERFPQALEQLEEAAGGFKGLPKSKRAKNFAIMPGNDVERALNILKTIIKEELPEPRDERKELRDSAKETYKSLEYIVSSLKLPNKKMLDIELKNVETGLKKRKKANDAPSTTWYGAFAS